MKRFSRHSSQEVCPWNVKFGRALPNDSPYRPRTLVASTDARTLARTILGMSQDEYAEAFRGSPMKRAKLRGLKRNAAVVLGNVGTVDDSEMLTRPCDDQDALVCEHASWALDKLNKRRSSAES